jgi:hypothetical protein
VAMKNAIGIIPAWDGTYSDGVLKDCPHTSDVDQAAGARGMYLDNDTIWRTMADLNRIISYASPDGTLYDTSQRRTLYIVDAVVAAEASQYNPIPYPLNTVLISNDPIAVDAVTARCMGFDSRLLKSVQKPALRSELHLGNSDPARIKIISNTIGLSHAYRQVLRPELQIYSWQGYLETNDFDPPEIVSCTLTSPEQLEINVRDTSSVSWVRVDYEYADQHKIKELQLISGDDGDGVWMVDFPHGSVKPRIRVTASDALFNYQARMFDL